MSDKTELTEMLESEGYKHIREVPERGLCGIRPFLFTWGLLFGLDGDGYRGRWCYSTEAEALYALDTWAGEGDPQGKWIKYKGEGGERSNECIACRDKTRGMHTCKNYR